MISFAIQGELILVSHAAFDATRVGTRGVAYATPWYTRTAPENIPGSAHTIVAVGLSCAASGTQRENTPSDDPWLAGRDENTDRTLDIAGLVAFFHTHTLTVLSR